MGLGLGLGPRLPAARRTLHGHRRAGAARARVVRLQQALPPLPHALPPEALHLDGAARLGRGELGGGAALVRVRVRLRLRLRVIGLGLGFWTAMRSLHALHRLVRRGLELARAHLHRAQPPRLLGLG